MKNHKTQPFTSLIIMLVKTQMQLPNSVFTFILWNISNKEVVGLGFENLAQKRIFVLVPSLNVALSSKQCSIKAPGYYIIKA